jgi:hypothetical protein
MNPESSWAASQAGAPLDFSVRLVLLVLRWDVLDREYFGGLG